MCTPKSIQVVCLNPSDVCKYLANSYRPYQLRNNKLAATYDGAHGQAAQLQMGMVAFYNVTAENASPLAVAGRFVATQRRASPQEEDERIAAYEQHSLEGLLQRECV